MVRCALNWLAQRLLSLQTSQMIKKKEMILSSSTHFCSLAFRFQYFLRLNDFFFFFLLFLPLVGRPQPEVRWLVNGLLVDDQYEHNSGDVIENRLLWPSVQRTDLNSVFTCQAVNTLMVEPRENSYVLDLHCKFLSLFISTFLLFSFSQHFPYFICSAKK